MTSVMRFLFVSVCFLNFQVSALLCEQAVRHSEEMRIFVDEVLSRPRPLPSVGSPRDLRQSMHLLRGAIAKAESFVKKVARGQTEANETQLKKYIHRLDQGLLILKMISERFLPYKASELKGQEREDFIYHFRESLRVFTLTSQLMRNELLIELEYGTGDFAAAEVYALRLKELRDGYHDRFM